MSGDPNLSKKSPGSDHFGAPREHFINYHSGRTKFLRNFTLQSYSRAIFPYREIDKTKTFSFFGPHKILLQSYRIYFSQVTCIASSVVVHFVWAKIKITTRLKIYEKMFSSLIIIFNACIKKIFYSLFPIDSTRFFFIVNIIHFQFR